MKSFILLAVAAAALVCGPAQAAEPYPSRVATLYVSFGPGGAGDILGRAVSREMSNTMGQAVVVENRPIPHVAPALVAKAKPDGYSMIVLGGGSALNAALFKALPYDPINDLQHISTVASFSFVFAVPSDSPFNSIGDLIAWAKANPGKLNIGAARLGSTQNLTAELLKTTAGIDAVIIPYRTPAALITALRAKDVHVVIETVSPLMSQIAAKSVRPLAMTSIQRFPALPDVPTVNETLPGFESTAWLGISAPAGISPDIVAYLNQQIRLAVATPAVQKTLGDVGMVAESSTPEEMSQRMQADVAKWRGVLDKAGIPRQ